MRKELIEMVHALLCDKYRGMARNELVLGVVATVMVVWMSCFAALRFAGGEYVWGGIYLGVAILNVTTVIRCVKGYLGIKKSLSEMIDRYDELRRELEE